MEQKTCPYCYQDIMIKAVRCPYCTRKVGKRLASGKAEKQYNVLLIVAVFITLIFLFIVFQDILFG